MATSIRRGRLQPSTRRRPDMAAKMETTSYELGDGTAIRYESTSHTAMRQTGSKPVLQARMPRVDKNASHGDTFQPAPIPPKEQFSTVYHREVTGSVKDPRYERSKPPARVSQRFSFGDHPTEYATMSHTLHGRESANRGRVQQADIGGWVDPQTQEYKTDSDTRALVVRGGYGSGGVLGMNCNIVTGEERPSRRDLIKQSMGPKSTLDAVRRRQSGANQFGDMPDQRIELVSGRVKPAFVAPVAPTTHDLKPSSSTRPW